MVISENKTVPGQDSPSDFVSFGTFFLVNLCIHMFHQRNAGQLPNRLLECSCFNFVGLKDVLSLTVSTKYAENKMMDANCFASRILRFHLGQGNGDFSIVAEGFLAPSSIAWRETCYSRMRNGKYAPERGLVYSAHCKYLECQSVIKDAVQGIQEVLCTTMLCPY